MEQTITGAVKPAPKPNLKTMQNYQTEIDSIEAQLEVLHKQLPALLLAREGAVRAIAREEFQPMRFLPHEPLGAVAERKVKTAPEGLAMTAAQAQIGQLNVQLQEVRAAQVQAAQSELRALEIAELSGRIGGTESVSRYELLMLLLDQRDELNLVRADVVALKRRLGLGGAKLV